MVLLSAEGHLKNIKFQIFTFKSNAKENKRATFREDKYYWK